MSVAPQINYKGASQSANPKYRYMRIAMNNITGSSFQINATSSQQIEFKMPNCVYNLANSYLQYEVKTDAQGANLTAWVAADTFEVATNAYFGSAGGVDICNLQYVNRYVKIWRKVVTKASDMIANDPTSQLYSSNALVAANQYPMVNANAAGTATGVFNYVEPTYITTGGTNAVASFYRLFPLSGIPDTIFSLNKDLYFTTDMYARFQIGGANQFAFQAGLNGTPAPTVTVTPAAFANNVTINSCYLYLAIEQNQLIIDSVMNKVMTTGLQITIPYTTSFRNSSNSTVANISIPLTSQYGKKLKRMLYTVWSGTESSYTCLDCGNYNGSKVINYNTFMDNKQLQDFPISTAVAATGAFNQDDFRENAKFIKDSCILNRAVYAQNWFHCDQFYEPDSNDKLQENYDDGLDMSVSRLWQLQATTANGTWTHYNFATFVRHILINSSGITYV